jgi:hypothetical protein
MLARGFSHEMCAERCGPGLVATRMWQTASAHLLLLLPWEEVLATLCCQLKLPASFYDKLTCVHTVHRWQRSATCAILAQGCRVGHFMLT